MKGMIKGFLALALCCLLLAAAPRAMAEGKPAILDAFADGGVIFARCDPAVPVTAFAVSSLRQAPPEGSAQWLPAAGDFTVFKLDGDYFLFVRAADGAVSEPYPVSVRSGYSYIYGAEGLTSFKTPVSEALAGAGSSVDALDQKIALDAVNAGLRTRASVAASAVSVVSAFAELGLAVPYQGRGGNYSEEDVWGVSELWGCRLNPPTTDSGGTYRIAGLHCAGNIVFAYRQAGLNIVNGRTSARLWELGARERLGDNQIALDAAQAGDIIKTKTGHTMLVVDRSDPDADGTLDSYLVMEMVNPSMTLSMRTLYSVRNCEAYDMSAVFENAGLYRAESLYWEDSFHIPESAYTARMQEALAARETHLAFARLLLGLGF